MNTIGIDWIAHTKGGHMAKNADFESFLKDINPRRDHNFRSEPASEQSSRPFED